YGDLGQEPLHVVAATVGQRAEHLAGRADVGGDRSRLACGQSAHRDAQTASDRIRVGPVRGRGGWRGGVRWVCGARVGHVRGGGGWRGGVRWVCGARVGHVRGGGGCGGGVRWGCGARVGHVRGGG